MIIFSPQYTRRSAAEVAAEKTFNKLTIKGKKLSIRWGKSQGKQDAIQTAGAGVALTHVPGLPGMYNFLSNDNMNEFLNNLFIVYSRCSTCSTKRIDQQLFQFGRRYFVLARSCCSHGSIFHTTPWSSSHSLPLARSIQDGSIAKEYSTIDMFPVLTL